MEKDWLKNNITPLLAILWTVIAGIVIVVCLFKDVKSDEKLTYVIVGSVVNIVTFILGYYYGASKFRPEHKTEEKKHTNEQTPN